eukprot:TRINITY_DN24028_c0_g1_i1.p1 TRINITY_DN24028_c0_g1~~TRINITY_DN24028_c0_g1_i1.p1  ORF type:complete len:590 (+),score=256.80 TRINITY_DN24028_c0_g1_i1:71-1840(+)
MQTRPGAKKGKRGQLSREEQERLQALEEERLILARLHALERAGEALSAEECKTRDRAEARERRRQRREERAVAIGVREAAIMSLSAQTNDLNRSYAAERAELQDRIERLTCLRVALEHDVARVEAELADARCEHETSMGKQAREVAALRERLEGAEERLLAAEQLLSEERVSSARQEQLLTVRCETSEARHCRTETKLRDECRRLEREAEMERATAAALQEALQERERQDEHSIALLRLLRAQLDDAKQQGQRGILAAEAENAALAARLHASEATAQELHTALQRAQKERDDVAGAAQNDASSWSAKLDEMRRSAAHVESELALMKLRHTDEKQQLSKRVAEVEDAREHSDNLRLAAEEKADSLAGKLRGSDKELFDRVSDLSAELARERRLRALEAESHARVRRELEEEMERRIRERSAAEEERSQLRHDATTAVEIAAKDMRQSGELGQLKVACFQLQALVVQKDRENEVLAADVDELKKRLERQRADAQRDDDMKQVPKASGEAAQELLQEQVRRLTVELDDCRSAYSGRETELRARVANLTQMFDDVSEQLRRSRDSDAASLAAENRRLQALIDSGSLSGMQRQQ